jgi:hypothetical protein
MMQLVWFDARGCLLSAVSQWSKGVEDFAIAISTYHVPARCRSAIAHWMALNLHRSAGGEIALFDSVSHENQRGWSLETPRGARPVSIRDNNDQPNMWARKLKFFDHGLHFDEFLIVKHHRRMVRGRGHGSSSYCDRACH